jgi:threonine dehydratase
MKLVYERVKLVIEPSAAVGLATVLYSEEFKRQVRVLAAERRQSTLNVGIIFSGGNVDLTSLSTLFNCRG